MKIKFTDSFIKSLKATGKPYSHGDTEHKGLLVRVSATGTKTFALAYHSKAVQKTRFLTFGQFGDTSLAGAFAAHAKARAALANGEDPQAEERASKKSGLSYAGLVDLFVAGKLARQRPCMTTLRLHRTGRRFGWADREVESITEDEATACLIKLAEKAYTNERGKPVGGRVEAFATKSLLGEMWRWAKRRKLIQRNIFADLEVEEARKPRRRSRVLSPDEIRAVWTELEHPEEFGFSTDSATALRLILATTARPGMVCGMMHNELVDLEAAQPKPVTHGQLRDVTDGNGPLWILPHERMKRDDEDENTEPFIVPMNAMAVSLIQATKMAGGRVLRACKPGGKELVTPNKTRP